MVNVHYLPDRSLPDNEKDTDFEKCIVKIPYVGIDSKWFVNRLYELTKRQLGIKLRVVLFVSLKR